MSVGFRARREPAPIPEHSLWTLHKDGVRIEARMRVVELGPEFRVYHGGEFTWSEVVRGRDFQGFADERRSEYERDGWMPPPQ